MMRSSLLFALFLCFSVATTNADITTGLIAWYPFDGDLQDASGFANHGTANGGLVLTTDRFGTPNSAYEFNGTNSYVSIPSSASLSSPDTAVTQAAWVMIYGPSQIGDPFGPVIMKSTSSANAFMYRMTASPLLMGAAYNNWFTAAASAQNALVINTWHHVATVFDGTSVRFYLDGVLVDTVPLSATMIADTRTLTIGADFPGILEIFYGKIDDVRIYARALTDSDIGEFCPCVTAIRETPAMPDLSIQRSFPNPTTGQTTVEFVLGAPTDVELGVYDVSGRRIRNLRSGALAAGPYSATWDGRDGYGASAPSGVYFFRLTAGNRTVSSRVIRIK